MGFLVDTRADISIISCTCVKAAITQSQTKLYAVNGTPIKTYGEKLIALNLGLHRQYNWKFIIANVSMAILGADFLERYRLFDRCSQSPIARHVNKNAFPKNR